MLFVDPAMNIQFVEFLVNRYNNAIRKSAYTFIIMWGSGFTAFTGVHQ